VLQLILGGILLNILSIFVIGVYFLDWISRKVL